MLKNAYLLAKIGADTAENELNFAEILPIGRDGACSDGLGRAEGRGPERGGNRVRCSVRNACSQPLSTATQENPAWPPAQKEETGKVEGSDHTPV